MSTNYITTKTTTDNVRSETTFVREDEQVTRSTPASITLNQHEMDMVSDGHFDTTLSREKKDLEAAREDQAGIAVGDYANEGFLPKDKILVSPSEYRFIAEVLDYNDFVAIIRDLNAKVNSAEVLLDYTDVVVSLGMFAGVRSSELVALTWDRILNLDESTLDNVKIVIDRHVVRNLGDSRKIEYIGKGMREFTVPHLLAKVLWKWKKTQRENGGCVGNGDFILANEKGCMVSKYMSERWVQDYLTENHLKKVRFDSLRYTFASLLLDAGMDVYILNYIMGHGSIMTTQRFIDAINNKNVVIGSF